MNYNWISKANLLHVSPHPLSAIDIIKEQTKELRGTQRQISRDRAALEKQEKQMVSGTGKMTYMHGINSFISLNCTEHEKTVK